MIRWLKIVGLKVALLINSYRIWCLKSNLKYLPLTCSVLLREARQRREELLNALEDAK